MKINSFTSRHRLCCTEIPALKNTRLFTTVSLEATYPPELGNQLDVC